MKRFFGITLIAVIMLVAAGGLWLRNGIMVDNFTLGPATLSNITLKWQKKLELQVETLEVVKAQIEDNEQPLDLSFVTKIPTIVQWLDRLFVRIAIRDVTAGQVHGSVLYEDSELKVSLSSEMVDVELRATLNAGVIQLSLENLKSRPFASRASGKFQFDTAARSGSGHLSLMLADSLPVSLSLQFDERQLSFQGQEAGEITTIRPVVDLFKLDPAIQKWITDYLTGSRYRLQSISGNFPWAAPLVLTRTFAAKVRVDECQYTFAEGFEAVKSDYTDVSFKEGVLTIIPHGTTFYGQDAGDSWLDINFNDPDNILLNAHILTRAKANQDIVNLLKYYDIPLPFRQTEGETDADLLLTVNLNTEDVVAKGAFRIESGKVDCWEESFDVHNASILLDSSKVRLEHLEVAYGGLFRANIVGDFDGSSGKGELDIDLQNFSMELGEGKMTLDTSLARPLLHYTIDPAGDSISASSSSWNVLGLPVKLGPFTTPFDQETLSGNLSPTSLSSLPTLKAELAGTFSIKKKQVDLQCTLLQLKNRLLSLENASQPFRIRYQDGVTVTSNKESQWKINDIPVTFSATTLSFIDTTYIVENTRIRVANYFDGILSGSYDLFALKGRFLLEDLVLKDEQIGHFLTPGDTLSIDVDDGEDGLGLYIPELDMEVIADDRKSWWVLFRDLGTVYEHSPLLQRFLVNKGSLSIESHGDGGYRFSGDIAYDYALLEKDGVPINRYRVDGEIAADGVLRASFDSDMELLYDGELAISSRDLSFNIPEINRFVKDFTKAAGGEAAGNNELRVKFRANRTSFIFSPKRQVLADSVSLTYGDGRTRVSLKYNQGTLNMDLQGMDFALAGEGFNDVFMDSLFPGANFEKGRLSLAAKGSFDRFTALVKVEDTILKNFKALNNVLALVNTIPALVTFSLPSYSSKGLPVDSIVAGFTVKDGVANFNSLDLESPEISIKGTGWINSSKETIEMDLNLITQAKKNVNKIPLVGFVLVGKEKRPSITVKISGNLFDPKVEHSTFQEVAATPFYMLYRTLALPLHLVAPVFGLDEEEEHAQDGTPKETAPEGGGTDWDH